MKRLLNIFFALAFFTFSYAQCDEDVCLSFQNVDPDAGTLELHYSSTGDISGFQFNLEGIEILSATSDLDNVTFNAETGFILGIDFTGSPLPAGDGTLLSASFSPSSDSQSACISDMMFGSPSGTEYTFELVDCFTIDSCVFDCSSECGGVAYVDDCGVCSEGNTGVGANADQDCNGDCFGEAYLDNCEICSGGNSGHVADSDIDCNGDCFGGAVVDECGECGGNGIDEGDCDCDGNTNDCYGECGGEAFVDDCGICSEGNSGNTENADKDCNGDCFGDAYIDSCGVCSEGYSGHEADSDIDCNGDCFGEAFLDDCDVCSAGNSEHEENSDIDLCGDCFGENLSCGGCTDPNALNYDPDAIVETGLCEYLGDIYISLDGDDDSGDGLPGSPFRTIQMGIDMAEDGDTVVVTPGTYFETLNLPDKDITIWGLNGVEQTTISEGVDIIFYENFVDFNDWSCSGSGCMGSSENGHDGTYGTDNRYAYFHYNGSNTSYDRNLYSPYITLPEDGDSIMVSFDSYQDWRDNCNYHAYFYVETEFNGTQELQYFNCDYSNGGDVWRNYSYNLTQYAGQQIRFRFNNHWYDWVYSHFDDLVVINYLDDQPDSSRQSGIPLITAHSLPNSSINFEGFTFDKTKFKDISLIDIDSAQVSFKDIKIVESQWLELGNEMFQSGTSVNGEFFSIKNSTVDIENLNVSNIDFNYEFSDNNTVSGGIYIDNSNVNIDNFTMDSVRVSNHNYSNWKGLGIYINNSSNVQVSNSMFTNNEINNGSTSTYGGMIYLNSGNLNISNSSFINNGASTWGSTGEGAAIFMGGSTSLQISNSIFDGNYLESNSNRNGAAIYAGGGTSITIDSTSFTNHSTSINGGAIYTSGDMNISNSSFTSSSASSDGGTIWTDGNISMDNSTIDNSSSGDEGGAIYGNSYETFNFTSSSITNSSAGGRGGGIWMGDHSKIHAIDSHIDSNTSGNQGGGIYFEQNYPDTLILEQSTLDNNLSALEGGGVYIYDDDDQTFISAFQSSISGNNSSAFRGGGIYGRGTLNFNFAEINDNTNESDGGGIWWQHGQVTIERTDIRRNHAARGGGVFILAENPIFQFDVIALNDATTIGGGMYIAKESTASSTPIIFNSTVVYNTSAVLGSGLLCTSQTNPVVQNSIFWGNLAADGVQMHLQGASEIFVTYSNVAGGLSGIVGFDDIIFQDNIDQSPDFEDIASQDYDLLITSPCIDAGNPNAPVDPDGTIPDQGAYYFAQDGIPNIGTDISVLDFGGVAVNSTSQIELPIYNTGLSELVVTGVVIEPENFVILDSTFTVGSMETYNIPMEFNPIGEGVYDGSITLLSNDPDEGDFTIGLHGAGDALDINTVLDIPYDQGSSVAVAWHRNVFDGIDETYNILNYNIWRRYDAPRDLDDDIVTMLYPMPGSTNRETWELVATSPSLDLDNYAVTVPTLEDSTSAGIPWAVFMISAHTDDANHYYVSLPDSGYSVDNIAPEVPVNVMLGFPDYNQYNTEAYLSWRKAIAPDLDYYTLSGLYDDEFYSIDTTMAVRYDDLDFSNNSHKELKVYATDIHENKSTKTNKSIYVRRLEPGANLISFNIDPEFTSLDSVFQNLTSNIYSVVGEGLASIYTPNGWIGNIEELNVKNGYWVTILGEYRSLFMVGEPTERNITYNLDPGYNLISFPFNYSTSIDLAFSNLSDNDYAKITDIISEGISATKIDDVWYGSLANEGLEAGNGYWVRSLDTLDIEFSGCDSLSCYDDQLTSIEHKVFDKKYNQSMEQSFYFIEEIDIADEGDILIAKCNGQIVGQRAWSGIYTDIPVMGNDGTEYTLGYCSENDLPEFWLMKEDLSMHRLKGEYPVWKPNTNNIVSQILVEDTHPSDYSLNHVYPNPFNPQTRINFDIPYSSNVKIDIYNIQGVKIHNLTNEDYAAGNYTITWDASEHASGVYFLKMTSKEFTATQKLMLIK